MSSTPDPVKALTGEAKAMLADTDPGAPLIDDEVWKQSLPNALADLSRFSPRRRKITLEFVSGVDTITLPPDFIGFDFDDFNRKLKPLGYQAVPQSAVFIFEWLSAGASDLTFAPAPPPTGLFVKDTTFQVISAEEGNGKEMWLEPAPTSSRTIATIYHARHKVKAAGADPEADPAVNTVPEEVRDALLMRMCHHALVALASLVAGDKEASDQALKIAGTFNLSYEKRVAFAPYGRRA
jgi:hypothetical protein